jgi:hypothetical protein
VLTVQASAPLFLHPYEADDEPFRLLILFADGTLAIIDPEAGTTLCRLKEETAKRHHTFETEDGRLILALSGHGGLVVGYDAARGQQARMIGGRGSIVTRRLFILHFVSVAKP